MRSRYTAFAIGEVDYLIKSHHSRTRDEVSREHLEEWSREAEWLGLEVFTTTAGGPEDNQGIVKFRARYRQNGQTVDHIEDAQFEREDGAWRFVTGTTPPFRRTTAKIGRNDPCTCGSGKKFKRCCGRA